MATIDLPVKNEPDWDVKLNDSINAINDEQETGRLSETQLNAALDARFLADDAKELNTATGLALGDSFFTQVGGHTPSVDLLATARSMTLTNDAVSGSYYRDVAVRYITDWSLLGSDDFVILTSGANPAYFEGAEIMTRRSEVAALQSAVLIAASQSRLEHAVGSGVGSWADYANTHLSGGTAKYTATSGNTWSWTAGSFGDYFALGFSFNAVAGAVGESGEWTINNQVVFESIATAPPATSLEGSMSPDSASLLVPWPVFAPSLNTGDVVKVESDGLGIVIADAVYKLRSIPPVIVVVKPTYTTAGGYLAIADDVVDTYRGDFDYAIAELCATFPRLRGRVVSADPHEFGWDADVHTITDGLHPNADGHAVIKTAIERSVARARIIRPFMSMMGVAGPNWPLVLPRW